MDWIGMPLSGQILSPALAYSLGKAHLLKIHRIGFYFVHLHLPLDC